METIYWTCGGVVNLASIYSLQSVKSCHTSHNLFGGMVNVRGEQRLNFSPLH